MSIINKDRTLRRLNEDEVFISKVEKLFLLGGLCFFCLAWILSKYFQWIEPNGVLAAVGFSALNFRYWRVAVGVMLKGYWQTDFLGRQFQIPGRIIAIPLVSIKVLLLALFVVFVASAHYLSFLLGFTAYMFIGMLLSLLARPGFKAR